MSGAELTQTLGNGGSLRIDASDFSASELAAAAERANISGALLILYNHTRLSLDEIRNISEAGSRRVIFDDVRML